MRRISALAAVCGMYLVSLGCHHVGGKCDCVGSPVPGSCNYYNSAVTAPQPATPAGPVQAQPMPVEKKPIMPLPADKKTETPKIGQ